MKNRPTNHTHKSMKRVVRAHYSTYGFVHRAKVQVAAAESESVDYELWSRFHFNSERNSGKNGEKRTKGISGVRSHILSVRISIIIIIIIMIIVGATMRLRSGRWRSLSRWSKYHYNQHPESGPRVAPRTLRGGKLQSQQQPNHRETTTHGESSETSLQRTFHFISFPELGSVTTAKNIRVRASWRVSKIEPNKSCVFRERSTCGGNHQRTTTIKHINRH